MRILRWSVVVLSLGLFVATLALFLQNRPTFLPASWGVTAGPRDSLSALISQLLLTAIYLFPGLGLGTLIVRRHPRHQIGWLLLLLGLSLTLLLFIKELTIYTHFTRPAPAGGPYAALAGASAWIMQVVWVVPFMLSLWLASIFPNGQLPSPRWRWLHLAILLFVVPMSLSLVIEDPMTSAFGLPNPMPPVAPGLARVIGLLAEVAVPAILVAAIGLIVLVVVRFRRARGEERQQFKWLALFASAGAALMFVGLVLAIGWTLVAGEALVMYSLTLFPIGIGVAVLRYRLYDVDLLIRRTLVYSTLTALLALIYFGGIALLQLLLPQLTGRSTSQLIIVLSTLAIAALFLPLRQRVQTFIDRRFYRRRYDAARILSDFAAATRDDPDIDRLTDSLVEVVNTALQSESVGVWLRTEASSGGPPQPARTG
jgi:hypothetical protein